MKKIFGLLVLSLTVSAFAQESVILDSKKVAVDSNEALLVRTSKTPKTIELTMKVPMKETYCDGYNRVAYQTTCYEPPVNQYRRVEICTNRVVTVPVATPPRGPNYNPPGGRPAPTTTTRTERVCRWENQYVGTYQRPFPCTQYSSQCISRVRDAAPKFDKVKIKFKKLPALGGSEDETFEIKATQRSIDSFNIDYLIIPKKTLGDRKYKVKKKGILGVDSYVIQKK